MSASGFPYERDCSFVTPDSWIDAANSYEDNYYAIIRKYGTNSFEWIVDDVNDMMLERKPTHLAGLLQANSAVRDFPIWKGDAFITNNLERLYRMWLKCQKDTEHEHKIIGLKLQTKMVDMDKLEEQMKNVARSSVLSKLSDEDRKIIEDK
jgi:hypothetical protein